jgi:aryl-alcohol dehydrogenase-like predicted oxidoreductase
VRLPRDGSPVTAPTSDHARHLAGENILPIGLGAMPMSVAGRPDEARSRRTIDAALDAGVRLIDTADTYALDDTEIGHNERLIAAALAGRRDRALIATKGGKTRIGSDWGIDGRPERLRAACEASLRRLRTDRIDLYQLHAPDPDVPFAESVGALRALQDAGKIRAVGLSNVSIAQLTDALRIVDVAAVQNELSPACPWSLDDDALTSIASRGVAFLAYSPLGGIGQGATLERPAIQATAERHGVSVQRAALAWLLALSPNVVPIPGASRPESIADSARATELTLTREEVAAISEEAFAHARVR